MNDDVQLGARARDTVTGFEGIITVIAEHLHGCRRIGIRPEELNAEGEVIDTHFFDEPRVEVIDSGMVEEVDEQNEAVPQPGGPRPEPTRDPSQ